ncbi:MAG: nucleoside recognition protein, partial [Methanosarcinales archaeon]|nr:nucleoside recognition protein [Methanosarcinales archaeon]
MLIDALITSAQYLAYIVPVMVAGIVIAELLVELGLIQKIGYIVLPLTRFAHLRDECGVSFLTAFASPTAANTMLVKLYDSDKIDKRELTIASITNSFPAIVMHWRTLVPVLIPLLGMTGMVYILILTFVGVLKTLVVLLVGHFTLEAKPDVPVTTVRKTPPPFRIALKDSLQSSKRTLKRILFVTIPTTVIVFILIDMGIFDQLSTH